jgi:hypothetical protein
MKEKNKNSQHVPIAWRTYLDGCGLISFIFATFWGVLIIGVILVFNMAYHYGFTMCTTSTLLAAIIWEFVRLERRKRQSTIG